MKEKIGILIGSVVVSVLIALAAMSIVLQNNWLPVSPADNFDTGDSIKVAQIVEQLESPQMYTIDDVQNLQDSMIQKMTVDEVFVSLPPDVIRATSNVLLNTQGFVTKKSLVDEYRSNDRIYNNLGSTISEEQQDSSEVDLNSTDIGNKHDKTISSSFKRRTDTINGKPVHVVTETTERYE